MLRRSFRSGLLAGIVAGLVIALVRIMQSRRAQYEQTAAPPSAWPRVPAPASTQTVPTTPSAAEAAEPGMEPPPVAASERAPATTVEPEPLVADPGAAAGEAAASPGTITTEPAGRSEPLPPAWVEFTGECPPTHPVKVKLSSGIFHVPGGLNYARCRPDRCYVSEEAAIADGFTKAKR